MIEWLLTWADSLTPMQIIGVILIANVIGVALSWSKRDEPAYRNFKVIYMVTNRDGFPDNDKLMQWGVFLLMSYGFLWELWAGKLTEWYVGVFAGIFVVKGAYSLKVRAEQDRNGHNNPLEPPHVKPEPSKKLNPLEGIAG